MTVAAPSLMTRLLPNRLLAGAALLLLAVVAAAVVRGRPHWGAASPIIWVHLLMMALALALTPLMLTWPKGTTTHRWLGRGWAALMFGSALVSLFFNARLDGRPNLGVFSGDVSPIHLLSLLVIVQVPRLVLQARRHQVAQHERSVRILVIGALLVAGAFTFPFGRMLGTWLSG